jgi:hypothetical protein
MLVAEVNLIPLGNITRKPFRAKDIVVLAQEAAQIAKHLPIDDHGGRLVAVGEERLLDVLPEGCTSAGDGTLRRGTCAASGASLLISTSIWRSIRLTSVAGSGISAGLVTPSGPFGRTCV